MTVPQSPVQRYPQRHLRHPRELAVIIRIGMVIVIAVITVITTKSPPVARTIADEVDRMIVTANGGNGTGHGSVPIRGNGILRKGMLPAVPPVVAAAVAEVVPEVPVRPVAQVLRRRRNRRSKSRRNLYSNQWRRNSNHNQTVRRMFWKS